MGRLLWSAHAFNKSCATSTFVGKLVDWLLHEEHVSERTDAWNALYDRLVCLNKGED
jgi:hypothetical protein